MNSGSVRSFESTGAPLAVANEGDAGRRAGRRIAGVFDSPQSIIYEWAENRLRVAKAVLAATVG